MPKSRCWRTSASGLAAPRLAPPPPLLPTPSSQILTPAAAAAVLLSRAAPPVHPLRSSASPAVKTRRHLICANPRKAFIPKSIGMDTSVRSS